MASNHHSPTPDKSAAFTGLGLALVFLLVTVFTIVKLTNAKYAGEAHEKGAAEATK